MFGDLYVESAGLFNQQKRKGNEGKQGALYVHLIIFCSMRYVVIWLLILRIVLEELLQMPSTIRMAEHTEWELHHRSCVSKQ